MEHFIIITHSISSTLSIIVIPSMEHCIHIMLSLSLVFHNYKYSDYSSYSYYGASYSYYSQDAKYA